MLSSKKVLCKATLRQVILRVIDWGYSQSSPPLQVNFYIDDNILHSLCSYLSMCTVKPEG